MNTDVNANSEVTSHVVHADNTITPHAITQDRVIGKDEVPAQVVRARVRREVNAAVSGAAKDEVRLSALVFKNKRARKSLTVHHLQRCLIAKGYPEAGADIDGWYGDLTANAIAKFQSDNNIANSGAIDAQTFELIFKGDAYTIVVL